MVRAIRCPSVKTIETKLSLPRLKAKELRAIMTGEKSPNTYDSVIKWVAQCYNKPSRDEKVMLALNEIVGGFGVEAINTENSNNPHYVDSFYRYFAYSYVNMGDTYDMTIVRNNETGRFMIASWGDIVEKEGY